MRSLPQFISNGFIGSNIKNVSMKLKNYLYLFILLAFASNLFASPYPRFPRQVFHRVCPVIVKGESIGIKSQKLIYGEEGGVTLEVVFLIKVQSVLKNILSDFPIEEGEVVPVTRYFTWRKFDQKFLQHKESDGVYMLDVDGTRKLSMSPDWPNFGVEKEQQLKKEGVFEAIGIDNTIRTYTVF